MLFTTQWALNNVTGTSYIGWIFFSEFLGSFLLILLGNGVVASVNLKKSKGYKAGWSAIVIGWALAVFVGAIVSQYSQAHLNFVVSLAILIEGFAPNAGPNIFAEGHEWLIVIYLLAQFSGMFVAQLVVDGVYWLQIEKQTEGDFLCFHSTSPAQSERSAKTYVINTFTEFMGTFVLIVAIGAIGFYLNKDGVNAGTFGIKGDGLSASAIAAAAVGAIGYGLGGPTGFALNPTRDLAPRIVYSILPLPNKQSADWKYSWVPIVGPILGGLAGAGVAIALMR